MARFSKDIEVKYDLYTYEGTKSTYEWICNSVKKMNYPKNEIRCRFSFKIGDIQCSCKSIEEFTEIAYSEKEYSLIRLDIVYVIDDEKDISFLIMFNTVSIETNNKVTLEQIVKILETSDSEKKDITTNNYIQNNYEISSINGNDIKIVQGNGSSMNLQEKERSRIKKWCESILQNLLSNGIWKLLSILAAIVVGYIFFNKLG